MRIPQLIIAGLGNPGVKYQFTRHNIGFLVIQNFAKFLNLEWKTHPQYELQYCYTFLECDLKKAREDFIAKQKHKYENQLKYQKEFEHTGNLIDIKKLEDENYVQSQLKKSIKYPVVEVHLIQPQSFMNLSGGPLRKYVDSIDMKLRNQRMNRILVICDEVRLQFGKIRLNMKGSCGGHNGLHDIQKKLGTDSYHRLRVGVTNPTLLQTNFDPLHYVLSKFDLEEREQFPKIFEKTNRILIEYIHKNKDLAMQFANSQ